MMIFGCNTLALQPFLFLLFFALLFLLFLLFCGARHKIVRRSPQDCVASATSYSFAVIQLEVKALT